MEASISLVVEARPGADGCSLTQSQLQPGNMRLQAGTHTVAGWHTNGCSLAHLRLQALSVDKHLEKQRHLLVPQQARTHHLPLTTCHLLLTTLLRVGEYDSSHVPTHYAPPYHRGVCTATCVSPLTTSEHMHTPGERVRLLS